jgi:hypothetical protein
MSFPVGRPESQRRDLAINAGALVGEIAALESVERVGQLSTPLSEIRERIERLHVAGLCVLHVLKDRWLVGLPDGGDVDWFAVFTCGHVSPRHVEASSALYARCAACDELAADRRNAFDVLTVLRHVESVGRGRSGAATAITSQSGEVA